MVIYMNIFKNEIENNENEEWINISIQSWHPEIGDILEGKLIEKKIDLGQYHQKLYVIEKENREKIEVWGKTQLDSLMNKVNEGDYVQITFNGTCKTSKNRQMNLYEVKVKRQ